MRLRLALERGVHRVAALIAALEKVRLAAKEAEVQIQHEVDGVLAVRHGRDLLRHLEHHRVEALGGGVIERHRERAKRGTRAEARARRRERVESLTVDAIEIA